MMVSPKNDPAQLEARLPTPQVRWLQGLPRLCRSPGHVQQRTGRIPAKWCWELARNAWPGHHHAHGPVAWPSAMHRDQKYIAEHCRKYSQRPADPREARPRAQRPAPGRRHRLAARPGQRLLRYVGRLRAIRLRGHYPGFRHDATHVRQRLPRLGISRPCPVDRRWFLVDLRGQLGMERSAAPPPGAGRHRVAADERACRTMGLIDRDLERIFGDNARQMLGLSKPTGEGVQTLYREAKTLIPGGAAPPPRRCFTDRWPASCAAGDRLRSHRHGRTATSSICRIAASCHASWVSPIPT